MKIETASLGRNPRILVRGVNWLGDAVMTTPALLRLRERFPASHIALLGPDKLQDLWAGHPAVDAVHSIAAGESPWHIGRRLRRERFDLALVLPNSPRSALEVWFSGAKRRAGYARSWRSLFLTDAIPARPEEIPMRKRSPDEIRSLIRSLISKGGPPTPERVPARAHHAFQYLDLVSALGGDTGICAPHLAVSESELADAAKRLPPGTTKWVGLNAGAEYGPAKRWPVERFVSAAKRVHAATGCGFILFGGKADQVLTEQLASSIRHPASEIALVDTAGRTTLRELCALMKLCRVVLTNDTGPMHVAAAVGTPVVVPFGSTSPELTGPGLAGDPRHSLIRSDAVCSPCFLRECPVDFRCMNGVGVDRIVARLVAVI
jgi:heptosyltransferase II